MRFFLFLLLSGIITGGFAQPDYIRTVQCYPEGKPFAEPVIELGGATPLLFSFDDLSPDINSYTYKIQHCDPDWNSSNLSPFTYLNGFFSNPLEDYNSSFNTVVAYTHFTLTLPNENVSMKLSGNYLLQVFNDAQSDTPVISQRFSVVEPKATIQANLTTATIPQYLQTSQQLNFTVNYDNLPVYNPIRDLKVYVTQNQDPHSRRAFTPTFVRDGQLVYGNGQNNIFNGLAPFRNFQCSSLVYYTQYVKDVIRGPQGVYNFILQPASVYSNYVPLPTLHGNYRIEAENTNDPELEADYVTVHFAIYYPEQIPQADVYVYGKFSDWQLLPSQKLQYDFKNKAYVGEAEVKQGNYDYMFAVVPYGTGQPDLITLQGNFYQTQNNYYIRCYLYNFNQNYYELVAYSPVFYNGIGF